jgi:hypothetical protein
MRPEKLVERQVATPVEQELVQVAAEAVSLQLLAWE